MKNNSLLKSNQKIAMHIRSGHGIAYVIVRYDYGMAHVRLYYLTHVSTNHDRGGAIRMNLASQSLARRSWRLCHKNATSVHGSCAVRRGPARFPLTAVPI
jgi:hypothetical protein